MRRATDLPVTVHPTFWRALVVSLFAVTLDCVAQTSDSLNRQALADYALQHPGDAGRGKMIFADESRALCTKCHTTDGRGEKAGPDLSGIGDKFQRRDLVQSVLEPSSVIAVGYATTVVTTKDGEEHRGVLTQATESWIELMDAGNSPVRIQTADIKNQLVSENSLMPEGWEKVFKPSEFADLIAYLETLHQPLQGLGRTHGMPDTIPQASRPVAFHPLFGSEIKFQHPVWFTELPGFTNRFVVLEGAGRVLLIERGDSGDRQSTVVDLTSEVHFSGGSGLLGMAFHPKFSENHKYYLIHQTRRNGRVSTKLVERQLSADLRSDLAEPARLLWEIDAVTQDHTGGAILFGPDGYLYFGMGDTGPQRDPQGHGQDLNVLWGKILRIDVDRTDGVTAYAVPKDNPFVGKPNVRPEIWAYGFREPWRASFDPASGDLWVGDVGQDRVEEVTLVRRGENHGWNVFEGHTAFSEQYRRAGENYVAPVFSYPHRMGVSVTGGYVYRGKQSFQMAGEYICGDFESRRIWALTQTNRLLASIAEIGRAPDRVVSFCEDSAGELYVVGYDTGVIYRMDLSRVDLTPRVSQVVAATSEESPVLWRYLLQAPGTNWFSEGFDDSSWRLSPGGFGTRGTPGAIVRTEWHTSDIWLRRAFTVDNGLLDSKNKNLALRMHHDEDVEVYLNGVELTRVSRWTTSYTEFSLPEKAVQALHKGNNVLAIHCHQNSGGQYIDAGLRVF